MWKNHKDWYSQIKKTNSQKDHCTAFLLTKIRLISEGSGVLFQAADTHGHGRFSHPSWAGLGTV
jgi:hypothetical protein